MSQANVASLRTCGLCGEPIPADRRADAKYCSKRCNANSHRARHGERLRREWREKNPAPVRIRSCLNCGSEFQRGRSDQVYCSRYCVRKAWEVAHAAELEQRVSQAKIDRLAARLERQSRPVEVAVCLAEDCEVTSADDPAFKSGRCNMHYLVEYHAGQRIRDLGVRICHGPGCQKDISRGRRNAKFCSVACQQRKYREDNLLEVRARTNFNSNKRRALKFNNPGYEPFTFAEWLAVLVAAQFRCTYCKTQSDHMTMDHVIALSRGGAHSLANVVPACMSCNISKRDKTVEEWLEWKKIPRRRRRRLL